MDNYFEVVFFSDSNSRNSLQKFRMQDKFFVKLIKIKDQEILRLNFFMIVKSYMRMNQSNSL